MKRMTEIALATVMSGFVGVAAAGADDAAGGMDRSKTKKVIEAAEAGMAEYCYTHALEPKKLGDGSYGANLVVDADNPLTGKVGVFKARFSKNDEGEVIVRNESIKLGPDRESEVSSVVVGTFKARELKKLYDFNRLYDRHRMLKKHFEKQVKGLRHTIKVKLPAGHHMPGKCPNHFKAMLRVTAVEWDRGELLPTLVIHTELIESKGFGLKAD